MNIPFYKYQGAGNDFILIDQREQRYIKPNETPASTIRQCCDRHFGIGADGLILLEYSSSSDFEMVYYNSDGHLSTMCGNGGRCIVRFAADLGIFTGETTFVAVDGPHKGRLLSTQVELEMQSVDQVEYIGADFYLDTGSPHYVRFVDQLGEVSVVPEAQAIRFNDRFMQDGTNVNFVEAIKDTLHIATYERGVEGETLACGTGVTAAAIAYVEQNAWPDGDYDIPVIARGGDLRVRFHWSNKKASQIWLIGPAEYVFKGVIDLSPEQLLKQ
ncbi:MAG: diaminopimelate epimerase [Bacteroidota bacterium]